jgi:hypothetical protein
MKTTLVVTAIFLFSFLENTVAQEYHPMLNNSSWILRDYVSCCRPQQTKTVEAGEDVFIGYQNYKKFVDPFAAPNSTNYFVYLREDANERKVYKLVNNEEEILYDFSLEQGDAFGEFTATVDYITINGQDHKKIVLTKYNSNYDLYLTQTWIEGVGSDTHPFKPTFNMYNGLSASGGYSINLVCSFQDGQHVYGNEDCLAMLNTDEVAIADFKIDFSPNPVATAFNITATSTLQNATFKLYNLQGQLVKEISNLSGNKVTVSRENLASGLYFAQLFENNKLVKASKIIVE